MCMMVFVPALLLNAIWEIAGLRLPPLLVAGIGGVVGILWALPFVANEPSVEFGEHALVTVLGTCGAVGGYTLGRLRRGILAAR